ncbi:uncharacterized protein BDCG_03008 [Blastomyces dermatitidis ER-3]|uniref:Uncharacterized protein n=1 Tax=Ajellomyces dermatitidis (strain ER-3 / ATCC MYA-2586) TaxID=559297 RepID=A0ABM9YH34_AJEDR|nr:uncharacterized protein BDCG_03008 [Blastomyces dermatitidis ER-3]EEQ87888.2 hypothetical protein BDCG_03008 [Blastomyces dermatitidis ER-3]
MAIRSEDFRVGGPFLCTVPAIGTPIALRQIILSRDSGQSCILSSSKFSRSIGSKLRVWPHAFERLKQMKTKARLKRSSSL